MKKILLPLLAASALSAQAQVVLFDFQIPGAGVAAAGSTYNIIQLDATASSGTISFTGLTDTTGAGAYTVDVVSDSGWAVALPANTPDGSASGFETAAWDDGMRTNNEADGATSIVFGGLNNALTYDLVIWAGTGLFFTADVDYSVGAITQSAVNTSTGALITLSGITPTSGAFTLDIVANGTGNPLTRGGAINAASLTAIPEPSTIALLGVALGGIALIRRRRAA